MLQINHDSFELLQCLDYFGPLKYHVVCIHNVAFSKEIYKFLTSNWMETKNAQDYNF